jgi:hypothetical protein
MIDQVANRALALYEAEGVEAEPADVFLDLQAIDLLEDDVDMSAMLDASDLDFKRALRWCRATRQKRQAWRGPLPWFIHRQEVAA